MKCVFCNGELNQFDRVCPYCGKTVQQQQQQSYGGGYSYGSAPAAQNPHAMESIESLQARQSAQSQQPVQNQPYAQSQPAAQNQPYMQNPSALPNQPVMVNREAVQNRKPVQTQQVSNPYGMQYGQNSYAQGYEMPEAVRNKNVLPLILVVILIGILMVGFIIFCILNGAKMEYEKKTAEAAASAVAVSEVDPADEYEAVAEKVTVEDLLLPGIRYGMEFTEFDDAMQEKYPELQFRDDHEEINPETGEVEDFSYYATSGSAQISLYGVEDTAIYVVGYGKSGGINFARLYFGDVYATDQEDYVMYCKNTSAREQENFGQLKASLDAQFGKGEKYDSGDPEMRKSYYYSLDNDRVIVLGSRRSKSDSDAYIYDTVLEYYSGRDD